MYNRNALIKQNEIVAFRPRRALYVNTPQIFVEETWNLSAVICVTLVYYVIAWGLSFLSCEIGALNLTAAELFFPFPNSVNLASVGERG